MAADGVTDVTDVTDLTDASQVIGLLKTSIYLGLLLAIASRNDRGAHAFAIPTAILFGAQAGDRSLGGCKSSAILFGNRFRTAADGVKDIADKQMKLPLVFGEVRQGKINPEKFCQFIR